MQEWKKLPGFNLAKCHIRLCYHIGPSDVYLKDIGNA
jgi:hypothetical protein